MYVQSDTALLADVFKNFRDKCIEIYELDPAHFLTAPGLVWNACLKKNKVELELLTDNNKYMKNYNKNKESPFLIYDDANNLYGWSTCKKLPVGDFKWADDLSMFTEDFIKNLDTNL